MKEQLDKLLNDLASRLLELQATSTAHGDMKRLLQQAAESHCAAEGRLTAQIATLRSELELRTQELLAQTLARAEAEALLQGASFMQGQGIADGQLAAALRRDLDASNLQLQAAQTEFGASQQILAGKQREVEGLQHDLASKQQELQAAAQSYAELEEAVSRASEEQSSSEDKLTAQLTALQDEVKVILHTERLHLVLYASAVPRGGHYLSMYWQKAHADMHQVQFDHCLLVHCQKMMQDLNAAIL